MKISIVDASNYFKGLLLLIRKDRKVTESEVEFMKRIGKALGFEREFCELAIHGILENEYVKDQPPKFSTKDLAVKFIHDGLTLAFSDNEIHPAEEEWLRFVAELNGLDLKWFLEERQRAAKSKALYARIEVDDILVEGLSRN
ncbi:MAG: TerB family tellurite resistance protein [Ignavibacteriales bacterium]|nr:TerB family tellurite resistance protein [Ignavibacteriales bacterium]